MSDLPEVEDITRITYRPDDVIVARLKHPISSWEAGRHLHDQLAAAFPEQQILIVDPSCKLEVMAPADAPTGLDLAGEPE